MYYQSVIKANKTTVKADIFKFSCCKSGTRQNIVAVFYKWLNVERNKFKSGIKSNITTVQVQTCSIMSNMAVKVTKRSNKTSFCSIKPSSNACFL